MTAASSGCEVAILQASPMGYPIYQRLGFETVVEYVGFVDPAYWRFAYLARLAGPGRIEK